MTGYAPGAIDARFAGCIVLQKPFSESAVAATIKSLLDGTPTEGR
jgi:hypothetical protein